jgi:iron complex outermembrane receptor protein
MGATDRGARGWGPAAWLALLLVWPPTPAAGQLDTVIVTALRRAENIVQVPLSISTLKDENLDLLTADGRDIRILASRVPSLHVESDFGRSFPRFYLRGLGNTDFDMNASQPVSIVFDDVVQESALLKGFPLFDIEQVEVLRGPQGTLFGRNSPAGVIKFASVKPQRNTDGYLNTVLGNFGIKNLDGAANLALGQSWAARVSVSTQHRDNRVHNPRPNAPTRHFEGYHDTAFRLQLLYEPGAHFSALFNVHGRDMGGRATVYRANIIERGSNRLVPGFDYGSLPTDGANRQALNSKGASLRLRWKLDDWTLHAISGYESVRFYSRADVDGGFGSLALAPMGPGVIPFMAETADGLPRHRQLTQEVRAESRLGGAWNWIAGLYYFSEDIAVDSFNFDTVDGNRQNAYAYQQQESRSWAAFGALTHSVNARLKLRAGLRYTDDRKDFSAARTMATPGASPAGPFYAQPRSSNVSWDASAVHALSDATNLYARVATGYRAPSIQGRLVFGSSISIADAERALSYEAGIKQELMQRRARVSVSLFQFRVRDMQLTASSGVINQNRLVNAARVEGQGVEAEFQANLGDAFKVSLGGSYNDVRIKDPALFVLPCGNGCSVLDPKGTVGRAVLIDGNRMPRSPQWIANLVLQYRKPVASGEWFVITDFAYRGKYNFFLYEAKEYVGKPLLDVGLRGGFKWRGGKYELAAFVRNAKNNVELVNAIDFNNMTGVVSEPRIVGAQFKLAF